MKITPTLIDKLIRLRNGERLPASGLRGAWVDLLVEEGVLLSISHGTKRLLYAPDAEALGLALTGLNERLGNLEGLRELFGAEGVTRAQQAAETGNSKLLATRACPGFPVNAYETIICGLQGRRFLVGPPEGSFCFVCDWQEFTVPEDVVIVGIENMENFRLIRQQRALFDQALGSDRLLFVSRYPQSGDLIAWLQRILNRYVHFGDFDLAGIHIFLTEFQAKLGQRSSFLIPRDIEERISRGSRDRYTTQYPKFQGLRTDITEVQALIELIHRYHRCYDQEGYIAQ